MDNDGVPGATPDDLWQRCVDFLRDQLSDAAWRTWFEGIRALEFRDGTLTLAVPSSLARQRLLSSYMGLMRAGLKEATGETVRVDLVVRTAPRLPSVDSTGRALPGSPGEIDLRDRTGPTSRGRSVALNPLYCFDTFVIGVSNRFPHHACLAVAEAPATSFNPLFIYGDAGLGKTHLLHAIGHHVRQIFPGKDVCYISTETFMNEFVDSIRSNTVQHFKRRYREVDVLLIDDIQFIQNKEGLQEEFFHTFNSLHGARSQIVMTSDRPPKAIPTLEDRLRSRFEWGLITDIQPPDLETRLAILRKKSESEGQSMPGEVLTFIAESITDNVRELEGALTRLAAYASLSQLPPTVDLAKEVLADLLPSRPQRPITPRLILEETASMFSWSIEDLCGRSRRRPLVTARQIAMYVFRELTDYSYPQIAREFGGRDHTTVMHAVEKIKCLMAERRQVFDLVCELINRIKHGQPS